MALMVDHLAKVEIALRRLHSKNLAANAEKSFWAVREVDYLGFRLTPEGVLPQQKKVAAIKNMRAPKNKKELRRFIGLVSFYRYMWRRRTHILDPLSGRTSSKVQFEWTLECQAAFEEMKRAISEEVLLAFPDYSQFELYTDASEKQLGVVLMQGNKTLASFSKKLTYPTKIWCG